MANRDGHRFGSGLNLQTEPTHGLRTTTLLHLNFKFGISGFGLVRFRSTVHHKKNLKSKFGSLQNHQRFTEKKTWMEKGASQIPLNARSNQFYHKLNIGICREARSKPFYHKTLRSGKKKRKEVRSFCKIIREPRRKQKNGSRKEIIWEEIELWNRSWAADWEESEWVMIQFVISVISRCIWVLLLVKSKAYGQACIYGY